MSLPVVAPIPLKPGDVLLYGGTGFWARLIRIKTWSDVSHVELVAPDGESALSSRDGIGVGQFLPIRLHGLSAVLRPEMSLDMDALLAFHNTCVGQRYDWWGLLRFFTIGKQSTDKQFCSEYVMRLLRAGGMDPFTPQVDADLVAPGQFLMSPLLALRWRAEKE
jgi:hypothetical protein